MIETLCIAAEVTAVLLILSIAMPWGQPSQRLVTDGSDASAFDSKLLVECGDALRSVRHFALLSTSRALLTPPELKADDPGPTLESFEQSFETFERLLISSSVDHLTKLHDRRALEEFIHTADTWRSWMNPQLTVCLFQIDAFDSLEDEHGMVSGELAIRHVANYLRHRLSGRGFLARFGHHSFAVALVGAERSSSKELAERVRRGLKDELLKIGESEVRLSASMGTFNAQLPANCEHVWEMLEDGLSEAVAAGGDRSRYYDEEVASWRSFDGDEVADEDSFGEQSSSEAEEHSADDLESGASEEYAAEEEDEELGASASRSRESSEESSRAEKDEVSADDIASLFKAAKTMRPLAKEPKKVVPPATPAPAASKTTEADAAGDKASKDDIAALFAAANKK